MSNKIKPSEVSEVLLQQLKTLDTNIKFEEVGVVLSIGDGAVGVQVGLEVSIDLG